MFNNRSLILILSVLGLPLVACGDDDSSVISAPPPPVSMPAPETITVTVTSLQPADGAVLTPVFLAVQDGIYDMFNTGSLASPSVEEVAEDGSTGNRITAALNSGGVSEAVATDGPLMPGQSLSVTFTVDPEDPLTQYLSFMSMVIPSNDAFIGNDDPQAIDLFDASGELIVYQGSSAVIISGDQVWDAGTEVNDEVFENTAFLPNMPIFPGQTVPDTGVPEGSVISLHEGLQGSLALGGEPGNVLTAFPGADFTEPGALLMQIEIIPGG